ncbi:MAG: DUF1289 domain-containing protein [Planctomycetota bacterium]
MKEEVGREGPPLSPCIRVCVLDEARSHCLGCARSVDEIARWWGMADDEKRAVLAALPARGVRSPPL